MEMICKIKKFLKLIHNEICCVYNVLKIRSIFGLYYETKKTKRIFRFLAKIYSLVYFSCNAIIFLSILYYGIPEANTFISINFVIVILECMCNVLIAIWTKEKFFSNFCAGVQTIDRLMSIQNPMKASSLYILYSVIMLKICHAAFFFQKFGLLGKIVTFCFNLIIFSNYFSNFTLTIMCNIFWSRMKIIRKSLQIKLKATNVDADMKMKIIKKHLHAYKLHMDNIINNRRIYLMFMFYGVIFHCYQLIVFISSSVISMRVSGQDESFWILVPDCILGSVYVFTCSVYAEMIKDECGKLKQILGEQLLLYDDNETLRVSIYDALDYLEARPPSFSALRIFPIDINLIKGFVGVSYTYIIVLLQTL